MAKEIALRPENGLENPALLATARAALEEAVALPDISGLVDKAEVIRVAARKAQLSAEAQNDWAEFKLDAERKAGAALAEIPRMSPAEARAKAGRASGAARRGGEQPPAAGGSSSETYTEVVRAAGISLTAAGYWQQVASIPDGTYEAYKATARAQGEITEAGALRVARAHKAAEKPPPDISEYALKESGRLMRLLDPDSDKRIQDLEKLIQYREYIPEGIREDLALSLEALADQATRYATKLRKGAR